MFLKYKFLKQSATTIYIFYIENIWATWYNLYYCISNCNELIIKINIHVLEKSLQRKNSKGGKPSEKQVEGT